MNSIRLKFNDQRRALRLLSRQVSSIFLVVLALTVANACFAFDGVANAKSEDESSPRVFVLSVADYRSFEKDGLQGLKRDVARVEGFFLRNVYSNKLLEYSSVDPNKATPEATIKAINELKGKVGKNDVVFFYYSGHGAYDPGDRGHYLQLKDAEEKMQALYRSDVKRRLLTLNARLVVIFTDCCNKMQPIPEGTSDDDDAPNMPSKDLGAYSPVIKKLFVDPETRGVVDLTSSVPGEYSFAYKDGSLATTIAITTFEKLNKELEADSSAKVDWRRFVDEWTKETEEISRERRKDIVDKDPSEQEKQTPHAYELPNFPRLGARVTQRASVVAGLQITEIVKDSPAERVGLKVGDFIVQIGERKTVKEEDYNQIVDTEPRETTITFVRFDKNDAKNDGKEQTVKIELNGSPILEPSKPESSESESEPSKPESSESESEPSKPETSEPEPEPSKPETSEPEPSVKEHEPFVGLAIVRGNKIVSVAPNSPASDAGLEAGDIVGEFDGEIISDSKDYEKAVAAAKDEAELKIKKKDGQTITVRLKGVRTKPRDKSTIRAQGFAGIGVSRNPKASAKVVSVKENSPAEKAGVQKGDLLRSFGGRKIISVKDYVDKLENVLDEEELVVLRNGALQKLKLVGLHNGSSSEQESQENAQNEASAENQQNAPVFGAGLSSAGNEVSKVVSDSPAAKIGLQVGDRLLEFNGKTIKKQSDFEEAVDAAESNGRKTVKVVYERIGRRFEKEAELNID